jgi:hypothetical protein
MKKSIRKDVTCDNCGWSWDIEPDDKHPYLCHQCGHENTKGETDEGAGPYDAPAFQMKPDHVHFKHQYNEQNIKSKYLKDHFNKMGQVLNIFLFQMKEKFYLTHELNINSFFLFIMKFLDFTKILQLFSILPKYTLF